ncbi:MAG: hypothetical protein HY805_05290 [Nitrospirae bacterium]|nr:hypothetical protein [Nitrospirota bacterium]
MKSNILLVVSAILIISIIITLNIFFQDNYQAEMAGQFNKQQTLLAETIAKNIADTINRLKDQTSAIALLIGDRHISDDSIGKTISVIKEDLGTEFRVFDELLILRYSSASTSVSPSEYQALKDSKRKTIGVMLIEDIKEGKLKFVSSINRGGRWSGALMLDVDIDSINKKFVTPITSGSKGYAWMMDSSGTLLYHPTQPEMQGKNLYKADASCFECHKSFEAEKRILESSASGVQSYIAPFGEDKILAFSRVNISPESFWIACVSIPYSEVTQSIRHSMRLHSILILAIFGATAIGASAIVVINRKRIKAEERARQEVELERYAKELEETLNKKTIELIREREKVAHAEKLASIGRLTAGIAHEIGNPLTSVFSFLQILREKETEDFKKESLDTVLFHINRIADIVRQLSGLTKSPISEFKEVSLNELITSSLHLMQYDKRAKSITTIKELSPSLPAIVTDANQLSQVFVNLILNAVDAMPRGGTLTIRSRSENDNIIVEFQDTGTGILEENLEKVFDPFFTTKDKGTGLGLSISYGIIKRLGGDISVESHMGKGTRFIITIPERAYGEN